MNEDNNPLLDLINNFQANSFKNTNENDNINFDTINDTLNNIFDSKNNKTTKEIENNNIDLNEIFNTLLNNTSEDFNFDFNTIQKLIKNSKKPDPRKDFLRSLKPFFKKERQENLNKYITYLTIINSLGIFNSKEENND